MLRPRLPQYYSTFRVHGYHHRIIGDEADLRTMTRADLYEHYRHHYCPANACVVAVGAFDAGDMLGVIREQSTVKSPTAPSPIYSRVKNRPSRGERRVAVERPVQTAFCEICHHVPQATHEDWIKLGVLDNVLSGSSGASDNKTSRLYQALVKTEIAAGVGGWLLPTIDPFLYSVIVTLREGRSPEQAEAAVLAEIERLQSGGITEVELERARKQATAAFAYSTESVTEQAYWLAQSFILEDEDWFDAYVDRLLTVTAEDVQDVANRYLTCPSDAVVGILHPTDPEVGDGMNQSSPLESIPNSHNISRVEMDNGIVLLVYQNPAVQSVNVMGSLHAGSLYETPEYSGLAALVASALMTGTRTRGFDDIHAALEDNGADLGFRSYMHKLGFTGKALAEDLRLLLESANDALRNPVFPSEHVERLRGEKLTWLQFSSYDTRYRAAKAMREGLYPATHPYHHGSNGNEESVKRITRADLQAFPPASIWSARHDFGHRRRGGCDSSGRYGRRYLWRLASSRPAGAARCGHSGAACRRRPTICLCTRQNTMRYQHGFLWARPARRRISCPLNWPTACLANSA